jgi:GNAT superfamily N-acetyltransferase
VTEGATSAGDPASPAAASVTVREVADESDLAAVRRLVLMHAQARSTTPGVEHMRADAERLPGPYGPPRGGIWLAAGGDEGVGCVALRPLEDDAAEVKRMFVHPDWRGRGVGRALIGALLDGARTRGYGVVRLGTLDDMAAARALYQSLGFTPIDRYRPDELVHTRFYELTLR